MMRRIAIATAVAMLIVGSSALPPAAAAPSSCSGAGLFHMVDVLPTAPSSVTTVFWVDLSVGYCAPSLTGVSIWGTVTGSCTLFTGSGTANGHPFVLTGAAGTVNVHGPGAYGSFFLILQGSYCWSFVTAWTFVGSITLV